MLIATSLAVALAAACYQVPVSSDLKPYADFPVENASLTQAPGDQVTIGYDLPQDLTGVTPTHITLQGTVPAGDGTFFDVHEDNNATTGKCVKTQKAVTCMLHYGELGLNPEANASFLANKYKDDDHLVQRVGVMRSFAGDAVGILSLEY